MGDSDNDPAAVGIVGGQQPALDEGAQFGDHRSGQLVTAGPPAGGTPLLIHGHQPKQPRDHLLLAAAPGGDRRGEGRIGLTGQSPPYPAELVVTGG